MNKKKIFLVLFLLFGFIFVFQLKFVKSSRYIGPSMRPTIDKDKHLVYVRSPFFWISRGNIVLYEYPDSDGSLFPKRVAGVPGDRVLLHRSDLYINDQLFIFPGSNKVQSGKYLKSDVLIDVPARSYFLVGDNPQFSFDSREIGFVKKENIVGKVLRIK